jgi:hypothetical protein
VRCRTRIGVAIGKEEAIAVGLKEVGDQGLCDAFKYLLLARAVREDLVERKCALLCAILLEFVLPITTH